MGRVAQQCPDIEDEACQGSIAELSFDMVDIR